MFLGQEPVAVADDQPEHAAPSASLPIMRTVAMDLPYTSDGGRYADRSFLSIRSAGLALAVHLAVVPLVFSLGYEAVHKHEERLVAVNLTPPSLPPVAQPDEPQPQRLETNIAAPIVHPIAPPIQLPAILMSESLPQSQPVAPAALPTLSASAPTSIAAANASPSTVTSDSLGTRMISGKPPRYPVESRRQKEQGTVELLLVLGLDGKVEAISIVSSSGFDRLDAAALSAVRHWRWQPTLREGLPVKVKGVVEIPFVLHSR